MLYLSLRVLSQRLQGLLQLALLLHQIRTQALGAPQGLPVRFQLSLQLLKLHTHTYTRIDHAHRQTHKHTHGEAITCMNTHRHPLLVIILEYIQSIYINAISEPNALATITEMYRGLKYDGCL